jgi:hypothetical protein
MPMSGVYAQKSELLPIKTPSAIEVAWAAGVYEGEGTIRQQRYSTCTAQVVQKDPEILYKLRDWFGGRVRMAHSKSVPVEKQCYMWTCFGDMGRLFIIQIYGFLSTRRRAQVDATRTFDFLGGIAPEGVSLEAAKQMLHDFHVSKLSTAPGNVQRRERIKNESWYIKKHPNSAARRIELPERVM